MTTHGHRLLHLVQTLAAVLVTLLGAGVTQLARPAFTFLATPANRTVTLTHRLYVNDPIVENWICFAQRISVQS